MNTSKSKYWLSFFHARAPRPLLCLGFLGLIPWLGTVTARHAAAAEQPESKSISCEDTNLFFAPYVWKQMRTNSTVRMEATMPGAYLKTVLTGTASIGLHIDGTANNGCPPSSMPVIEWSVDQGPFKAVQLSKTGEGYTLNLATGLDAAAQHRFELYFRAADLLQKRWTASTAHLRVAGLAVDRQGVTLPVALRAKRAIAYGDSIVEGVGADGLFTSWSMIEVNNARVTWAPLVCAALDCEYGQLGSGGWGMCNPRMEIPPLPRTWDRYDAFSSRLVGGLLSPEPDYVFCALGTNDPGLDITEDYVRWLTAMRAACGRAMIFCVAPPLGVHKAEVRAAVSARRQAGDNRVSLIDLAPLESSYRPGQGATAPAFDGVHPSVHGHAQLGTLIATEAQKALCK